MTLSYPVSLPITVLVLVLAGAAALVLLKPRARVMWPSAAVLVVALGLAARYATWSAVLDEQGVRVTAPLALFHTGGEMRWSDVNSLVLRGYGRRHNDDALLISGMTGRLSLPIGDMNPDEAERLVAEIQRRVEPHGRDLGGEGFRRRVRTAAGVEGIAPALLRLRQD